MRVTKRSQRKYVISQTHVSTGTFSYGGPSPLYQPFLGPNICFSCAEVHAISEPHHVFFILVWVYAIPSTYEYIFPFIHIKCIVVLQNPVQILSFIVKLSSPFSEAELFPPSFL